MAFLILYFALRQNDVIQRHVDVCDIDIALAL